MSDFSDAIEWACAERDDGSAVDAIADEVVVEHVRDLLGEAYGAAVRRFAVLAEVTRPHDAVDAVAADVHQDALRYTRAFALGLSALLALLGVTPEPQDVLKAYYRLRDQLAQKGK